MVTGMRGMLSGSAIERLRAGFHGPLLKPEDDSYEQARRVWNGAIDRYPALVARCTSVADVQTAVEFARDHDLLVAVRGGGHSIAGYGTCDGGLVIDLGLMKGIRVTPATRTARAQPGLVWREFDHESQVFGLATPGGVISTTGVAGFTLGGGLGRLTRKHGLACDNLRSVDIVLADGRFVTASEEDHPDLFWAIRGGGGNFGIVTSFEFGLHDVGPVILGGAMYHELERADAIISFFRDFMALAPDELNATLAFVTARPLPFIPPRFHGEPIISIEVCYAGPIEKGEEIIRPLREFGPPVAVNVGPVPYTALQQAQDPVAPPGLQNYWKASFLTRLDGDVIKTLMSHAPQMRAPFSMTRIVPLGGAVGNIAEEETAFGPRGAPFVVHLVGTWDDPAESEIHIRRVRDFHDALRPFALDGTYLNFVGNEPEDVVRAAFGIRYRRLVTVKRVYDPTNFFRLNHNIPPAVEEGPE
jgi:hypothetical protein